MLREANHALHAQELVQLVENGLQIKGKTPLTVVATSLKRDKRFARSPEHRRGELKTFLSHAS